MLTAVQQLYDYDAWATQRLLSDLRQLPQQEFVSVEASGHGSIRDTFAHLLAVQWRWFSWFSGRLPAAEAILESIPPDELGTLQQAEDRWIPVREQTERTIKGLSQEAVTSEWPIDIPGVAVSSLPLWKMLFHVANHGTHTRAQIIAALRRSGQAPQNCDLIAMLLDKEST